MERSDRLVGLAGDGGGSLSLVLSYVCIRRGFRLRRNAQAKSPSVVRPSSVRFADAALLRSVWRGGDGQS